MDWIGLDPCVGGLDWIGSAKMDPCPTLRPLSCDHTDDNATSNSACAIKDVISELTEDHVNSASASTCYVAKRVFIRAYGSKRKPLSYRLIIIKSY